MSDCAVLVADTYHLPDSPTHPSLCVPHNSRNTLKKSESGGKGHKINIVYFPSLPHAIVFRSDRWTMKVF